jgi:glycosyltransferase involved in cell wall biosynthesis
MKVLYVVQNYFPSIGGTQMLFQNIAEKSHVYYGDEAVVYTTNSYLGPDRKEFKEIEKRVETINGVSVHRFPFITFHYWIFSKLMMLLKLTVKKIPEVMQLYRSGPWSPSLNKAIASTDADVIVASSCNYLYMLYPLYRHKLKNPKPFVFQGAVHFTEDNKHKALFNKTLDAIKAADYYIANTDYERDRLVALNVDADKIVVTGTAVDMDMYANGSGDYYRQLFNLGKEDILVGYLGRIEATKGIDVLVKAFQFAKAENKKIHLVVAGFKSSYAEELEKYSSSIDPEKKMTIHFLYNLSTDEKIKLYHAIDIYVLPSKNESFGIVFLEAWSCKKPVIGTDIGALRSVISQGIDGLLFQPDDAIGLSDKILLLSKDEKMRMEFGLNGFYKTAQHHTWPVVTKKYREVCVMAIEKFNAKKEDIVSSTTFKSNKQISSLN